MADKEKIQMISKSHKKRIKKVAVSVILIACIITVVVFNVMNKNDDTKTTIVTKENTVKKGNLTVGITESATMEIGSITQSYELDTSSVGSSSLSSSGSGSSSSSGSSSQNKSDVQGMQNGGNAMGMAGGQSESESTTSTKSTTSSGSESVSDSDLVIEKVCITSGQNVKKGDTILKLTNKSVSNVRKLYKEAVSSARLSLKEAKIDRDSDKLTAEYEYKDRLAAGKSAKTTYNATVQSLNSAVVAAQNNYNTAVSGIKTLPSKIKTLQKKIKKAGGSTSVYKSTSSSQSTDQKAGEGSGTASNNMSGMGNDNKNMTQESSANTTTSSDSSSQGSSSKITIMQQQLATYKQQLSEYKSNLTNLKSQLKAAKKAKKTGEVSAQKTYDAAMLQYSNAKTLYNVAMDGIDDDVKEAQETLKDAQKELKTFEKYAGTGVIKAECSGTVTSVGYEDGETLSTDTDIATYKNAEAVTISVSVAQDDISEVEVGDTVNINLTAYEDETFHGKVTSISSTTSSDTSTVSYPVVVTMTGDVSSVYAGMSAEVTFVTKEIKDVLYISNKAVTTEGTKSYVTKKKSDGSTTKTQVKTGFSDGHNVQIESGLIEGDTVLIESRVSE